MGGLRAAGSDGCGVSGVVCLGWVSEGWRSAGGGGRGGASCSLALTDPWRSLSGPEVAGAKITVSPCGCVNVPTRAGGTGVPASMAPSLDRTPPPSPRQGSGVWVLVGLWEVAGQGPRPRFPEGPAVREVHPRWVGGLGRGGRPHPPSPPSPLSPPPRSPDPPSLPPRFTLLAHPLPSPLSPTPDPPSPGRPPGRKGGWGGAGRGEIIETGPGRLGRDRCPAFLLGRKPEALARGLGGVFGVRGGRQASPSPVTDAWLGQPLPALPGF